MRILGIDAGTVKAGLAVLDDRERLVYSAQVTLFGDHPAGRLSCLRRRVQEAVTFWHVDRIAIEQPIQYQRPRTAGAVWVGQGFGAVLQLADEMGWPRPLEVNPTTAKATLTRNPRADKAAMMQCAAQRWPAHAGLWGEDEADSAAVALVGLMMVQEAAMAQAAGAGKGKR